MRVQLGEVSAMVEVLAGGGAVLSWTDGLNEWREECSSLPVALCRLAGLAECATTDWWAGFTGAIGVFEAQAKAFLSTVVAK